MKFIVSQETPEQIKCDVLAILVTELSEQKLSGDAARIDNALGGFISNLVNEEKFKGKEGQILFIHTHNKIAASKVILVGLGKSTLTNTDALRKVAAQAARKTRALHGNSFALVLPPEVKIEPFNAGEIIATGIILGLYKFDRYKTKEGEEPKGQIETATIQYTGSDEKAVGEGLHQGEIIATSVSLARDLINESASTVTAIKLAEVATEIGQEYGVEVTVFDEHQLATMNMNAYLAVNKGSAQPPRFIHMSYKPATSKAHIALVGKGITFDSGGLDLKPPDGMLTMKCDMSGAAAVISTMKAIAQLKPNVTVDVYVAATDNMPGKDAYKPGDIIRTHNGKTIEIGNTDAEGRVTLADALSYALEQKPTPDEIIDIATLTGACKIALGGIAAGVFGNDQEMINRVLKAGEESGEKLWPLPLYDDFNDMIKSDFADLKNIGGRYGGASTAAAFLREFVGETKWVHLDIAGPAWYDHEEPYRQKGGTGFAVASLVNYILARDN